MRDATESRVVAAGALIERHWTGVHAFVRANLGRVVRAGESASDLVQSTCREVLAHLSRFRHGGEQGFERWLYATARRKIQDRHRHRLAEKRCAAREAAARSSLA